ncbi:Predicted N-acetyltransferase YhbS [Alkalibacterium subtropicum]|uniref:Predicted N-acetyltransferase YhbS n=1 Tax=Alkalibacterium subtropicum TaxID=753702 RepID=A0A1I1FHP9_9LACT|nr:GNAT family N-acetyltransferase [Alkalibacterium subtropicum]SFB98927.1 Predicted N-acetyltransferase YhbS [Alkalibacterium subtropicum]
MNHENHTIAYYANDPIDVSKLVALYESVGWVGYTEHPEKMEKILAGSLTYFSAWKGDQLVGLIRTVGDDASILYIQDILVHPDHQRLRIGSALVNKVLDKHAHIRQIVLLTDDTEKTQAFYTSLGFQSSKALHSVAFIKMSWEV